MLLFSFQVHSLRGAHLSGFRYVLAQCTPCGHAPKKLLLCFWLNFTSSLIDFSFAKFGKTDRALAQRRVQETTDALHSCYKW